MSVPEFQTLMLPYLERIRDKGEHSIAEMMDHLAKNFNLSTDELEERIPSGRQTRFYNRVTWAGSHLRHAGLVENTRRGFFRITPRGLQLLSKNLSRIDLNVLDQFPEHREFRTKKRPSVTESENANARPKVRRRMS
jgi:restriction system protein